MIDRIGDVLNDDHRFLRIGNVIVGDGRDVDPDAVLAVFLRLAEGLDRSHSGVVRHAGIQETGEEAVLEIEANGDCSFEIFGVERERKQFTKVFGKRLSVVVKGSIEK